MIVLLAMDPEVAVIVTCDVPTGVGVGEGADEVDACDEDPPQPLAPIDTTIPNRSIGMSASNLLRFFSPPRRISDPRGSSEDIAIPRLPCRGERSLFAVYPLPPVDPVLPVAEMVTVLVTLAAEVTVREAGEKLHVASSGSPVQARLTVPLKPLLGAILMVVVALDPVVTVKALDVALIAKFPGAGAVATAEIEPKRPSFSLLIPAAK